MDRLFFRLSSRAAFTLVELLVVILILAILIAVAAPSFLGQTTKAHDSAAAQSLTVAYKAAKAGAITEVNQGLWVNATAVVNSINGSEPQLNAVASSIFPATTSTGGEFNVHVEVVGTDLKLRALSASGNECLLVVPENGAPQAIVCTEPTASVPYTPVNTNLTNNSLNDYDPVWSLDGSYVYFDQDDGSDGELWRMDANGANAVKVHTDAANWDWRPMANATYLFYLSTADAMGNGELFRKPVGGGSSSQLTTTTNGVEHLSMSHDGTRLVYWDYGASAYRMVDEDGVLIATLTHTAGITVMGPAGLSPDKTKVIYGDGNDLYVANVDGSGTPTLLYTAANSVGSPAFSPDGSKVVFFRNLGGGDQRFTVMNADGSGSLIDIATTTIGGGQALWSPDGSTIVYDISDSGGDSEIYSVNAP